MYSQDRQTDGQSDRHRESQKDPLDNPTKSTTPLLAGAPSNRRSKLLMLARATSPLSVSRLYSSASSGVSTQNMLSTAGTYQLCRPHLSEHVACHSTHIYKQRSTSKHAMRAQEAKAGSCVGCTERVTAREKTHAWPAVTPPMHAAPPAPDAAPPHRVADGSQPSYKPAEPAPTEPQGELQPFCRRCAARRTCNRHITRQPRARGGQAGNSHSCPVLMYRRYIYV